TQLPAPDLNFIFRGHKNSLEGAVNSGGVGRFRPTLPHSYVAAITRTCYPVTRQSFGLGRVRKK
ncbi:hypothetical protein, partial [Vibrio anguillarum]|uniref:hypothetical protein n=1 Tax=Vibrio anguillarum TaxID=55601 RepID=UPI001BE42E39